MRRFTSSPTWLAASSLGLWLSLSGCSGDDTGGTDTTTSASTDPTTTASTDPTTTASTDPTTTTDPTATATTTETTSTTDPSTTDPSTTDPSTTDSSTTDPTTTTDTGDGVCGDGQIQGDEVCDDGNKKTEAPSNGDVPHSYGDGDCLDACDLLASTCGDGVVDAGEECDDGNDDSQDDCTTSCTINDGGFDAPCIRDCGGACDANDVLAGEIVGCENVTAPAGAEKVCFDSGHVKLLNIIDRKIYFAEGSCMIAAQKCEGAFCPKYVTFGDYDGFNACPAGTALADRVTEEGGVKVSTKVCHKTCESDSDCRWNGHDDFWKQPGQFRCQATPDSNNIKICADAQNF